MTALRACLALAVLGALPAAAAAGTITGRVTDQISGAPVTGLEVGTGAGTVITTYTRTDAAGVYSFPGLDAGQYSVCFLPKAPQNLLRRCWRDERRPFYGTPVEVPEIGTAEADTMLAPGTSVAGRVVDYEGEPLAGVCVTAWAPQSGGWGRKGDAVTAGDGTYTIPGLTPGDGNRIVFSPGSSWMGPCTGGIERPAFAAQWFDRKPSMESATPVSSRRSETVGGVDGILGPEAVPPDYVLPRPPGCVVPELRNRTFASARRRLAQSGCSTPMPALKASRSFKRGRVISTSPRAKRRFKRGHAVRLIVSRGR